MGLEASIKEEHEPIILEIVDYDNIDMVLSKAIIPFSEVMEACSVPYVYVGHEKIPFEKRDPVYKTLMKQEFCDAMRYFRIQHKILHSKVL